jgi:hypothetical protein
MSNLDKKDLFDADTSFFDLPIVWRTVGAFIGLFVAITCIILWNGSYTFEGSGSGFNFFVKEFGFPLGVLSLLIPIIAVYAAQHRSVLTIKQIQTSKLQIKETQVQNTFANYFKHKEEFENILYKIIKADFEKFFEVKSAASLYKCFFPLNSPDTLALSIDGKSIITLFDDNKSKNMDKLSEKINNLAVNRTSLPTELIVKMVINSFEQFGILIKLEYLENYNYDSGNSSYKCVSKKLYELLVQISTFSHHIESADILRDYDIDELLKTLSSENGNFLNTLDVTLESILVSTLPD